MSIGGGERWPAEGAGNLRASDADREQTAAVLRQAAAEGRLDLTELEERLERAFSAKTYAELALLTADLPNAAGPDREVGLVRIGQDEITAVLSDRKIKGRWLVPPRLRVRAVLGSVTLDFTEAALPMDVTLDLQVGLAQVTLVVPDDIACDIDGVTTFMSEAKNKSRAFPEPGTPRIRVRGTVVLGEVVARGPKRRRWFR
jgi:hypothetical protein